MALLAYAPVGFVLVAAGAENLAIVGAGVVLALSMVPDVDQSLPFVTHRGITHTVWFAIAVGLALGWAGFALGSGHEPSATRALALFGFGLGTLSILAHLLADALTPMGVRPFEPIGGGTYSLDLARAGNPLGNGLLLVCGLAAAIAALSAGRAVSLPWV
jgi:inner membrane protein